MVIAWYDNVSYTACVIPKQLDYMSHTDLARAINSIHPLEECVQDAVQRIVKKRTLPKGAILLNEGDISDEVHFIEKGLVRAFYHKDKKEITSWMAHEGRFIWPLPSYLFRHPSRESIQVVEPTTLLSIKRHDLDELKQRYEAFSNLECSIMGRYILLYDTRIQLLLLKAEDRFEEYQKLFPEISQRVPLKHIATYLGIDPATLSRIRGSYKSKLKKS